MFQVLNSSVGYNVILMLLCIYISLTCSLGCRLCIDSANIYHVAYSIHSTSHLCIASASVLSLASHVNKTLYSLCTSTPLLLDLWILTTRLRGWNFFYSNRFRFLCIYVRLRASLLTFFS